ncbi:MAG: hypothetical protein L0Y71_17940 [Gemmataceae bacterium]|nr:hypothetical protein [Gemmataceae bacterium]
MRSGWIRVLALLSAVADFDTAQGMQAEGTWEIVPSPNAGSQVVGNTLLDVVALSATDAWAVGVTPNQSQYLTAPLVMHWDGAQWSIASTPAVPVINVKLNAAAAVGSDDVWAVGYSDAMNCGLCAQTLIEHWDGTSWSVVPSPNPGWANTLYGVAAVSANDIWAVGDQWLNWSTKIPLILHYDGAGWTAVDYPPIDYGELASAFALTDDDVWAVGVSGVISTGIEALALHWDEPSPRRRHTPPEMGPVPWPSATWTGSTDPTLPWRTTPSRPRRPGAVRAGPGSAPRCRRRHPPVRSRCWRGQPT